MSFSAQELYQLLPSIYRLRDAEQQYVLRQLMAVIAEQVQGLDANLEQLYDDQFIETCADWAVPYIGDLVGYRSRHSITSTQSKARSCERNNARAEVANTIAYRRRKGTAAVIEQLARDVTGWPASVVEFFQQLSTTQYLNHIRLDAPATLDVRSTSRLQAIDTPFEPSFRTADVRHIATRRGKYNIPNVGIFLWRIQSYPQSNSPAYRHSAYRYQFSPLGIDVSLFNDSVSEDNITQLSKRANMPHPIDRLSLFENLDDFYGLGKSILVQTTDANNNQQMVAADRICACDLSDWDNQPLNKIGLDPVLGRLAFPKNEPEPNRVTVSFFYGFSAELGGGQYSRPYELMASDAVALQSVPASSIQTIGVAVSEVGAQGIVEVTNSDRYPEFLHIWVPENKQLEIRATADARPLIAVDGINSRHELGGDTSSEIVLNGLLIQGQTLCIPETINGKTNRLQRLRLSHCTLLPRDVDRSSVDRVSETTTSPAIPAPATLIVEAPNVTVEIDRCILGEVRMVNTAQLVIRDSILDAGNPSHIAYADLDEQSPGGELTIENSTVIGKVRAQRLPLVSNAILWAKLQENDLWRSPVIAEQRQSGCVRFSYLPSSAQAPKQYACVSEQNQQSIVLPSFVSLRYGHPGYAQLHLSCAKQIRIGADDESEMGAFHFLHQPQREVNLQIRLQEYLRFGLEAGIFYAS